MGAGNSLRSAQLFARDSSGFHVIVWHVGEPEKGLGLDAEGDLTAVGPEVECGSVSVIAGLEPIEERPRGVRRGPP